MVAEKRIEEEQHQAVVADKRLREGGVGLKRSQHFGEFCEDLLLHFLERHATAEAGEFAPDFLKLGVLLVEEKLLDNVFQARLGLLQVDDVTTWFRFDVGVRPTNQVRLSGPRLS